jgi:hypothetical protein
VSQLQDALNRSLSQADELSKRVEHLEAQLAAQKLETAESKREKRKLELEFDAFVKETTAKLEHLRYIHDKGTDRVDPPRGVKEIDLSEL